MDTDYQNFISDFKDLIWEHSSYCKSEDLESLLKQLGETIINDFCDGIEIIEGYEIEVKVSNEKKLLTGLSCDSINKYIEKVSEAQWDFI